MTRPPRIAISAGEASGDRLGAGLARAILRRRPDAVLYGMGGDDMAEAGVRIVQSASEVAVVGFLEVLSHLPAIRRAMKKMTGLIEGAEPDVLVPIDFPDFNLRLAGRARRAAVPVVYFVSPQVWAWRQGRVRKIGRLVRRMLVLFPFETGFYEDAGVPVTFVGHPAVEAPARGDDATGWIERVGLEPERETVALMPGSRRGEVSRILPHMLGAARRIRDRRPGVQFVIPRARTVPSGLIEGEIRGTGPADTVVHEGDYPEILRECTAGIVASGTATLDAALAGLPIVVVYRMRPVSYVVGRLLVRVDHVALPNLVAGRRVVPELVQGDCTPERIADEVLGYLESPARLERVREELAEVRERLGEPGAYDRAAAAVLSEIGAESA